MAHFAIFCFTLFFLPQRSTSSWKEFDYCKISREHTMCKFEAISKNCINYESQDENETRAIINDHNAARNKYAGGKQGYFLPNMLKMYWDQELADIAERWACQCKGKLDQYRSVRRFQVGQIVYSVMNPESFSTWKEIWDAILQSGGGFHWRDYWGRIIHDFDMADPLSFIYNPFVKHFGCSLARYLVWKAEESIDAYTTTLVCNYAPIQEHYKFKNAYEDFPCRFCPSGTVCSTEYNKARPPVEIYQERNLCIDPYLEKIVPKRGAHCPAIHSKKKSGKKHEPEKIHNYDYSDGHSILRNRAGAESENDTNDHPSVEGGEDDAQQDSLKLMNGSTIKLCAVTCPEQHTMCMYKNMSSQCRNFINLMSDRNTKRILHMHNKFRDNFAGGTVDPPHPLASNIRVMHWSDELQAIAHRWAIQCTLGSDQCRDIYLPHFPGTKVITRQTVTQNIGWKRYNITSSCPSAEDIFSDWTKEAANFVDRPISEYFMYLPKEGVAESNFIQLIWAHTHYVGCSFITFQDNSSGIALLVCNYSPGGKSEGKSIYIPGGPCSNCFVLHESLTSACGDTYPNLCSEFERSGRSRPQYIPFFLFLVMMGCCIHFENLGLL